MPSHKVKSRVVVPVASGRPVPRPVGVARASAAATPERARTVAMTAADTLLQARRFAHPGWRTWPYNVFSQTFVLTQQMTGAFQMLRSNDLVWSRMVRQYLMDATESMNDLMAWSADATRMPCRMHSGYLRRLFLENDLAEGRYVTGGQPVAPPIHLRARSASGAARPSARNLRVRELTPHTREAHANDVHPEPALRRNPCRRHGRSARPHRCQG